LVMSGEKLLVVMNAELAVAIQHDAGIENSPTPVIPFGDAASDENAVPARKRGHGGDEGAVGHMFGERAAMLRGIEQVAGVHAFRQHNELGALAHRLIHQLRGNLDIVLDVAEASERLGRRGAEALLHHILPVETPDAGRSLVGDLALEHVEQWLFSSTKRGSMTLSVLRGHGRSMSTKSATRVGRRVRSSTRFASCTASSRSCETNSVVVL